MAPRVVVVAFVLLAGCVSDDSAGPPEAPPAAANEAILGLEWDTARLGAESAALRLRFEGIPADAPCSVSLRAEGRYGSGAPVYLWAAPDVDDPPVSVLVQEGADAAAAGFASQDAPRPPGAAWSGGFDGEVADNTTWLLVAAALGPDATKATFTVTCPEPIPMPAVWHGTAEVVALTAAGPESGAGVGAGPVGASVGQQWQSAFASPQVNVRIVRASQDQLAESGEVVLGHPGGEETVALPTASMVHRLDGPAGEYRVEVDRLQAGAYLGAVLLVGTAPAADPASAGLAVTRA